MNVYSVFKVPEGTNPPHHGFPCSEVIPSLSLLLTFIDFNNQLFAASVECVGKNSASRKPCLNL